MPPLPLLQDADRYRPHTIDMMADADVREYWIRVFEENRASMQRGAVESVGGGRDAEARAHAYGEAFGEVLERVRRNPTAYGELSICRLCELRRQTLLDHGFEDPYVHVKRRENEAALALLAGVLEELDALETAERHRPLAENIFAGNLFDLGCAGTIELYESGRMDFYDTRRRLPDRPWLVDDLDAWIERCNGPAHRKAVVLLDNAGADLVLGMLPLARQLLQAGSEVVLAANTHPALNDITFDELGPVVDRVAGQDPVFGQTLGSGRLKLVPSGNDKPVIDLRAVSDALADASRDADLLILEGMGRALETNYHARFTCDTLKLAMVKEQDVADFLGGRMYDVVFRYEKGG